MSKVSFLVGFVFLTILAVLFAPLPPAVHAADLPSGTVQDQGIDASCSLSVPNPYKWYSSSDGWWAVRANAKVTCTTTVSYITVVAEVAGPGCPGGSYSHSYTCYNTKSCSAYAYCYYIRGSWQSRGSGYAPGWQNYKQSNWISL